MVQRARRRELVAAVAVLLGTPYAAAQTTGLVPLNDLGSGLYRGAYRGGLYPGGANAPPAAHAAAAAGMAAEIVPRDASGAPDPQGWIAMIAVGMSNTTHEFAAFERNEDARPSRNARVVLMDTGLGGQSAAIIADPGASYWTTMMQRLSAMGLTAAQVQVAWLKEADARPPDDFPVHAMTLRDELEAIANNLHDKFPNLKICYVSSRIYGGYAEPGSINPEPQAYESGFSVKWLIEDQIEGDPGLNHGQLPGPVRSPLLLWGPYLWADGTNPRSDGLVWTLDDFESDRTHPSPAGEEKVAGLLSEFFAAAPSALPWWPANRSDAALVAIDAVKDAHVSAASPGANFGPAAQLVEQGGAAPQIPYVGFDVLGTPRPYALTKLSLRVLSGGGGGGRVSGVADAGWSESAIAWNNAPPLGPPLVEMPQSSRDGTIAANVTGSVNADPDGLASFALSFGASNLLGYHSREAGQPPRLVATVPCANAPDGDGDGITDICDCAPSDGTVFAPPAEVRNLAWTDAATLAWDALPSGSGTLYDLMSGDLDEVASYTTGASDVCLANDTPLTSAADTTATPSPGKGRFFLVRGTNACGTGRYETSSDLRDRKTTVCP